MGSFGVFLQPVGGGQKDESTGGAFQIIAAMYEGKWTRRGGLAKRAGDVHAVASVAQSFEESVEGLKLIRGGFQIDRGMVPIEDMNLELSLDPQVRLVQIDECAHGNRV